MFSIYKKELQSFFYTPFAYVMTALFMFLFTLMFNNALGNLEQPILQFTFPDIFYNVIFFFIFLIPILTMRTFADERKFGTEVLLMTSPVGVIQIILGKYLANITVFLFMIVRLVSHGEPLFQQLSRPLPIYPHTGSVGQLRLRVPEDPVPKETSPPT